MKSGYKNMLRLFDKFMGTETNLTTKSHYDADSLYENSSDSIFKPCYDKKDFKNVYKFVSTEILQVLQSNPDMKFSIQINGKLNGNDTNKTFYDLDSYRQFLENNSLLDKVNSLKVVNH
jgi:hypothetical protein